MARMFPPDIDDHARATPGEKLFFRFVRDTAVPHDEYSCWYEPAVGEGGATPDFVMFAKPAGVVVFEVKDWEAQKIISYDPLTFEISQKAGLQRKTNPDRQAKGYVDRLLDVLRCRREFLDPLGKVVVPVGRMIIFPNICEAEYTDRGLDAVLPRTRVLLSNDLDPAGEIARDSSGKRFLEKISIVPTVLPFSFRGLPGDKSEGLKRLLWPESRIELPERDGAGRSHFDEEVRYLDEVQSRLALQLGGGHRVIKGPPWSGKTLVLVHRCMHLSRYDKCIKRVLFTCFNIALVNHVKRLLHTRGVGTGPGGVEVHHLYDVCARVLGEDVPFENEDQDYYDLVLQEALDRVKNGESRVGPYDAVFIDEGQDFSTDMLKGMVGLLKPEGQLVIALDSHQDIYGRRGSLESAGIQARGRTRELKRVYRSTPQIHAFCNKFFAPGDPEEGKENAQMALFSCECGISGPEPRTLDFQSEEALLDHLGQEVQEITGSGDYKRSEIGILYDDKHYEDGGFTYARRGLPERILACLESRGIPVHWASRNVAMKESFDNTADRLTLISVHSSKGLDFECVYLIGIDPHERSKSTAPGARMAALVGMTRARYSLTILRCVPTRESQSVD
jgi:hypothetical protein